MIEIWRRVSGAEFIPGLAYKCKFGKGEGDVIKKFMFGEYISSRARREFILRSTREGFVDIGL